jgi:hypothetical protein
MNATSMKDFSTHLLNEFVESNPDTDDMISFVKDGDSNNRQKKEFTVISRNGKTVKNVYCLYHFPSRRCFNAIEGLLYFRPSAIESLEEPDEEDEENQLQKVNLVIARQDIPGQVDPIDNLLTAKSEMEVRSILNEMTRTSQNNFLWTCLHPSEADNIHLKALKQFLLFQAELFAVASKQTLGETKNAIIASLIVNSTCYEMIGRQGRDLPSFRLGTTTENDLANEDIDNLPAIALTVAVTENLKDLCHHVTASGKPCVGAIYRKATVNRVIDALLSSRKTKMCFSNEFADSNLEIYQH